MNKQQKALRMKLEEIKELYRYYFVTMVGRFGCDYREEELDKFMSYLDRKYGVSNLDISTENGVDLIDYSLSSLMLMTIRTEEFGYKCWDEYMIGTLGEICKEVIDFVKAHRGDRYSEEKIRAILGE